MVNYIVLDLEFMCLRGRSGGDIIEIGAIKMTTNEANQGIIMTDLFHSYVKPERNPKVNAMTTALTGITQEDVDGASGFKDILSAFTNWIGDEPYYFIAWGPDDKYQLVRHCRERDLSLSWLMNYNDLQLQFTMLHGENSGNRFGLKRALEHLNLVFMGRPHQALDDALNTGRIFAHVYPKLTLTNNNAAEEPLYTSELVYSSGSGEEKNMPFSDLANMLGMVL
ncbi:exonuclease domain-containing protein [Paenibacillus urinalis]|uniref:Exonuclease domain-containing protein n=1 Tax=Paenibacillus urinalis TaxID=521520 RepID=A0AAX3N0R7_9BACL|nr:MULTISPECIES: 3'-5' exonuclease [Paenibacillus]WDH83436.1 exonuclease domain-containing protein [Paenibacillus urinalis]WDH99482.1 exonuclease domain-containing protein [Paenibacillus urinalis]WDI03115.1 exonuclease domain-containing protein [Paenibacillus urinalis]GAK41817.1 hypothetical protein TCA2_4309 [Paenibacillus sp. TCA20]